MILRQILFTLLSFLLLATPLLAVNQIDSLEAKLKATKDDKEKFTVMTHLSKAYSGTDIKKAIEYSEKALALAKSLNNDKFISKALTNMGLSYRIKGDMEKADSIMVSALNFCQAAGDKSGVASVAVNLGTLHAQQGHYQKALEYYLVSLNIREDSNEKENIASSSIGVGLVYMFMGNYDKALEYYTKSLQIYEEINDKSGITMTLNNMANVYQRQGNVDKALELHFRNLKIRKELGDPFEIAQSLGNISLGYAAKKDFNKALENALEAHGIMEKVGEKHFLAESFSNIGLLHGDLGNDQKNIEYQLRSLKLGEELQALEIIKTAYGNLSDAYENINNKGEALRYFKLFSGIKDSIFTSENSKMIAEMNTKYETEKKEKEIVLLQKDKELQKSEIAREKNFRTSLYGIIGSISLLGVVLLFAYRNKKKSNELLSKQKQEITLQKEIIEEKNKDITDSINYAKRIQEAILPPDKFVKKLLPESFILYKPKDIVSGDFYFVTIPSSSVHKANSYSSVKKKELVSSSPDFEQNREEKMAGIKITADISLTAPISSQAETSVIFGAVDCTGHGVPGAFMSIVGHNLLSQAVNEHHKTAPAEILNEVNIGLSNTLRQTADEKSVKDGMDAALCTLTKRNGKTRLEFAGANNPLWVVRKNQDHYELQEIKGNKFPIGIFIGEELNEFNNHEIELNPGDSIYVFTDGYADQFGGQKGKKFKVSQLKELILSVQDKPMSEQKVILENTLLSWKGRLEQVDDICIIGVRI